MVCITISSRTWCDSVDCFYEFWSSRVDGRYAQGSWITSHRGVVSSTPEQNLEKAINDTIGYLSGIFLTVYGRAMTRNDICGQEGYKTEAQKAADIAAALQFELQQQQLAAQKAAEQLALKTQMLGSTTATWQSTDTYNIALADTNKAIDIFNNVTLPELAAKTAQTEQILRSLPVSKTEISQPILEQNKTIPIVIITIILIIIAYTFRGK